MKCISPLLEGLRQDHHLPNLRAKQSWHQSPFVSQKPDLVNCVEKTDQMFAVKDSSEALPRLACSKIP